MHSMINPEQLDLDWQVENITNWRWDTKGFDKEKAIFLKVVWIGGDKQWISLDDMRLHDPFLVIRFALKNKPANKPGWEWTKNYIQSDKTLNKMVYAYKASRFLRNIKFGVEVPQSTRHAYQIDQDDNNDLWKKLLEMKNI